MLKEIQKAFFRQKGHSDKWDRQPQTRVKCNERITMCETPSTLACGWARDGELWKANCQPDARAAAIRMDPEVDCSPTRAYCWDTPPADTSGTASRPKSRTPKSCRVLSHRNRCSMSTVWSGHGCGNLWCSNRKYKFTHNSLTGGKIRTTKTFILANWSLNSGPCAWLGKRSTSWATPPDLQKHFNGVKRRQKKKSRKERQVRRKA
jgi:hypothetical protein